jgi:NADP-dependent 3-hydroxy acid dehydrogenase YdfG
MMQALHAELRNRGIRATTIIPAEVDTPILDKRPLVPGEKERSTMMQAEDVARAIMTCCTMPQRTVIEEIVMSPTFQRDTSKDVAAGYAAGAPPGAK